ncbi:hypothetical protein BDA99DRAFT_577018 [Phascolomyces articulosus]|uniref:Uncharacterized protein n=1 Tax=Phascolomyces articulosus TaxID=60185 RepID=A0AAD5JMA1_9FUNG|nr:hypothetical protein BDA99DRAFT_577018 [Phascolomyces articulosus]
MSTDSTDEKNHGFSTQDQETIKRLLAMDRETFLANWGLESTEQSTSVMSQPGPSRMDTSDDEINNNENSGDDSDSSLENDYLQVLRNPITPIIEQQQQQQQQPPVTENTSVMPESQLMETTNTTTASSATTTSVTNSTSNSNETREPGRRSLRPRKVNQMQPYTYEKSKYNELVRRSKYTELLQYDPNNSTQTKRRHKKTSEDRYEDEGVEEDDEMMNPDDEFEQVDPEELMPTKRIKKLFIPPSRHRQSHSEELPKKNTPHGNKKSSDVSKKRYSPTPTTTPSPVAHERRIITTAITSTNSDDIWSTVPRTTTVYSRNHRKRSKMEKSKGPDRQIKSLNEMDNSTTSPLPLPTSQSSTTHTQKMDATLSNERNTEHIHDALRDAFPDLFDSVPGDESNNVDDDTKSTDSHFSLDSVLIRAAKSVQQQNNNHSMNPSFEDSEGEEQLHIPRRKKRLRRSHSLDSENADEDHGDVFDFPMDDTIPIHDDNHDDSVFDFPEQTQDHGSEPPRPKPLQQLVTARSRRRSQPKDDGFIVHDGSEYDLPKRKKNYSLRGVLPFNYKPDHEKPVTQQAVVEEEENDPGPDSPIEEDSPALSLIDHEHSSSMRTESELNALEDDGDEVEFQMFVRSSPVRRRQRTLTGYVQRSRRTGEKTYSTNKSGHIDQMRKEAVSRARSLQTKTPRRSSGTNRPSAYNASATNNSRRNRNSATASSSSSFSSQNKPPPSIQPRRSKKRNLNGELYILPGPGPLNTSTEQPRLMGWQSSIRPHLSIRWTETGELCPEPDESIYSSSSPLTTERQQSPQQQLDHNMPDYTENTVNSNNIPSSLTKNAHLQMMEEENNGPSEPFARLLYKHPNLAINWGMPVLVDTTTAQLQHTIYLQHEYLHRLISPQEDANVHAGLFDNGDTPIELFHRNITLTQDMDKNKNVIKNLFREAFKYMGALFDDHFATNPTKKDTTMAKLFLFFQFVTEALNDWVLRLPGGQQRPMIEFLNSQCRLFYSRTWSIAGLDDEHYQKSRPLISYDHQNHHTLPHAWKALLALLIYALDWATHIQYVSMSTSGNQEDCKQRLLWLLYWIGPTLAQISCEQKDASYFIYAKEPLVAEGWVCLFHLYASEDVNRSQCWMAAMDLLEQQREQDHLTIDKEMERKWHWLLVLNALRYVDSKGIYTRPEEGIMTVETMCGRELANGLSTAIAGNESSGAA